MAKRLSKKARSLLTFGAPVERPDFKGPNHQPMAVAGPALNPDAPTGANGITLPPGTYWFDLIPRDSSWSLWESWNQWAGSIMDPSGYFDEFMQSWQAFCETELKKLGAEMIGFDVVKPGFAQGGIDNPIRAVVAFEVPEGGEVYWGPEQIQMFHAVPSLWKGKQDETPDNDNTIQAPEVESTSELLTRLASNIASAGTKTAGVILGVLMAGGLLWVAAKARVTN